MWRDTTGQYTYGELRQAVAAVRDLLAVHRMEPGSPVALLAPNGLFWIASYLAVFAAGMVVVPLPATIAIDEAAARAAWAGCAAAILGRIPHSRSEPFVQRGIAVIGETAFDSTWDRRGRAPLRLAPVDPDQDAAYLFTSGTTGAPRAVRLTHRNLQANTTSILGAVPIASDDRMLVLLPFSYVFGASLLHTHLRVGAGLVGHATAAYPETTVAALAAHECTGLAGVPSVFTALVRNSSFTERPLPRLRTIQQAGGALATSILHELVAAQPHARVHVMYGQTEATARLSCLSPDDLSARPGSIGRGIPGVTLRVVDDAGDDVPPGQVGQIVATGENVSPGYLHDPAASAAKMSEGILHTGDLARVDAEGFLYVVDRAEGFIKTWGHRVSAAEVESAVMRMSDIVAAAAFDVPDERAGERIELAIVARDGSGLAERDVAEHCQRALPAHMRPMRVHVLGALPLNANGKVVKHEVRRLCAEREAAVVPGRRDEPW
ncbi:AMP-binding protein [Microbacterium sp. 18062]|uniref:class I adenylate-forming enzyme family protein n=1 Tax=Microbacterium sp. 18062 TaxID=2681410 RepID=UPI00135A4768|nr:AMP-binding protein [Microbacterium sp. 18062]